jgi:hypothetical protein
LVYNPWRKFQSWVLCHIPHSAFRMLPSTRYVAETYPDEPP